MIVSALRVHVPPAKRAFLIRSSDQLQTLPFVALAVALVLFLITAFDDDAGWRELQAALVGGCFATVTFFVCSFEAAFTVESPSGLAVVERVVRDAIHAQGYTREEVNGEFRRDAPRWLVWDVNHFRIAADHGHLRITGPWLVASIVRRRLVEGAKPAG